MEHSLDSAGLGVRQPFSVAEVLQNIKHCQARLYRLDAERFDSMPGDVPKLKARLFRTKAELLEAELLEAKSSGAFPPASQSEGPHRSLTEAVKVSSHDAA